jgi:hypothetical protein
MKVRKGFVSNSSSSSFIVHNEDLQEMKDWHVKVYKVKDLVETMEVIKKCIDDAETDLPFFIWQELTWFTPQYYEELLELYKRSPDSYITEEYSRDRAWENNWMYETFETDL